MVERTGIEPVTSGLQNRPRRGTPRNHAKKSAPPARFSLSGHHGAPFSRFAVASCGDNKKVSCPTCDRLDRDEELLRSAVEERIEALRGNLPEDLRAQVLEEERMLADLLAGSSSARSVAS